MESGLKGVKSRSRILMKRLFFLMIDDGFLDYDGSKGGKEVDRV